MLFFITKRWSLMGRRSYGYYYVYEYFVSSAVCCDWDIDSDCGWYVGWYCVV